MLFPGKHDARPDHTGDSGIVTREFTRRYQLPDDIDPQSISLKLHGMQLVGERGLDWNEAPGDDRIGTFLVVLPFKVFCDF